MIFENYLHVQYNDIIERCILVLLCDILVFIELEKSSLIIIIIVDFLKTFLMIHTLISEAFLDENNFVVFIEGY